MLTANDVKVLLDKCLPGDDNRMLRSVILNLSQGLDAVVAQVVDVAKVAKAGAALAYRHETTLVSGSVQPAKPAEAEVTQPRPTAEASSAEGAASASAAPPAPDPATTAQDASSGTEKTPEEIQADALMDAAIHAHEAEHAAEDSVFGIEREDPEPLRAAPASPPPSRAPNGSRSRQSSRSR